MPTIHSTAIVHDGAEIGDGVDIGPFCVVGEHVRLGANTRLIGHAWIDGVTSLGADCTVYPFASIGTRCQDLKFEGGKPGVRIGDRTTIREYVTVNAATGDGDFTVVGNQCLLMAYVHIAHDCLVGDEVIVANAVNFAGHVVVEEQAIIGGICGIHQFVRIGRMAMVGGCSRISQDIPPYMLAAGNPLEVRGINRVGLGRRGVTSETQQRLKQAYRLLYRKELGMEAALAAIESDIEPDPDVDHLVSFVRGSERGISK